MVSVTLSCTCCIKSTSLAAIRWPFLSFHVRSCRVSSRGGCNILCLPPHTTSGTQPLDANCFGPLKTYWAQLCHECIFSNPGCVITKYQFSAIFSQAWSKGMTINNLNFGFRNTGIYPFNPQAILCKVSPKFQSSKDTTSHKAAAFTEKQHHNNKNITPPCLTSSSDTNQLNSPPVLPEETI